jgi:hypothetical protein
VNSGAAKALVGDGAQASIDDEQAEILPAAPE